MSNQASRKLLTACAYDYYHERMRLPQERGQVRNWEADEWTVRTSVCK